ncbi:hypothetical protein PHLH5_07060 [Pseudomonas sp. Cab53]|nr:hypothetical protein PHLH5_07060 [Pseudomonas sp. Cab53]
MMLIDSEKVCVFIPFAGAAACRLKRCDVPWVLTCR